MEEKLSPYQQWKKNLGSTRPWDMINPNAEHVSEVLAKSRLDICKSCTFLIKATSQCKKCGCFMQAKTKLRHAECPEGKW
jgi:hypothetical protein